MNADASHFAIPTSMRFVRYLWRIPALLGLLLLAVIIGVLVVVLPSVAAEGREPFAQGLVRWWSAHLIWIFGFRIRVFGELPREPLLIVANHVSWLDVVVVYSQRAACFVAKSEIARWPLIGWLAGRAGTIFHRRGSTGSLDRVRATMVERLRAGRSIAIFPEGGIDHTRGIGTVRTFHARIFQPALEVPVRVQPVALCYCRNGHLWNGVGFRDEETFAGNFLRLLGESPLDVEVHCLAPIAADPNAGRKHLANTVRGTIAGCVMSRA